MIPRARFRGLLGALAILGLGCGPPRLPVDREVTGQLLPGQALSYRLDLAAGEFVHVVADSANLDLTLTLVSPAGETLAATDTPWGDEQPEELMAVTAMAGRYELQVGNLDPDRQGAFTLHLAARQPAGPQERALATITGLLDEGYRQASAGQTKAADERYRQAADQAASLGAAALAGEALRRRGALVKGLGPGTELAFYTQAATELGPETAPTRWAGFALRHGQLLRQTGQVQPSLDLFRSMGDAPPPVMPPRIRAMVFNELAQSLLKVERYGDALEAFDRALALWPPGLDMENLATCRLNRGQLLTFLGDAPAGQSDLEAALRLRRMLGEPHQRALAALALANALVAQDELRSAKAMAQEAVSWAAASEAKNAILTASIARITRGYTFRRLERRDLARTDYAAALAVLEPLGHSEAGRAHQNLGVLALDAGELGQAQSHFLTAQRSAEVTGDAPLEIASHFGLARVARREGRVADEDRHHRAAVARIEAVRRAAGPARQSFFADQQPHLEERLRRLLPATPTSSPVPAAQAAEAFWVSESAHARAFLDQLDLPRAPANAPDGEGEQGASAGGPTLPGADLATRKVLGVEEIRRQVLPPGGWLLEFKLGEPFSHLFVLTHEELRTFILPGRRTLEDRARAAYQAIQNGRRGPDFVAAGWEVLAALSRDVLGPLADVPAETPLVLIPDGALHTVAWAALPHPRDLAAGIAPAEAAPLGLEHDLALGASASVLAALRQRARSRPASGQSVALLGDPIYQPGDSRLPPGTPRRSGAGASPYPRLLGSHREVDEIRAALPTQVSLLIATGLSASRTTVLADQLRHHRVLHFATHAEEEPPRLVLSTFDAQGRPISGDLTYFEVANLELPADLVVLSACSTARGDNVASEGPTALAQAFQLAGATQVLATLWKIDDATAPDLMAAFYRHLFRADSAPVAPATALRRAQREMRERHPEPYHWAAFVLQGPSG